MLNVTSEFMKIGNIGIDGIVLILISGYMNFGNIDIDDSFHIDFGVCKQTDPKVWYEIVAAVLTTTVEIKNIISIINERIASRSLTFIDNHIGNEIG